MAPRIAVAPKVVTLRNYEVTDLLAQTISEGSVICFEQGIVEAHSITTARQGAISSPTPLSLPNLKSPPILDMKREAGGLVDKI